MQVRSKADLLSANPSGRSPYHGERCIMMDKDRTFESVDKSVTFVMDELSASERSDASIIALYRVMEHDLLGCRA
jgi:hypothetical protein